jgi:hypothetical protein
LDIDFATEEVSNNNLGTVEKNNSIFSIGTPLIILGAIIISFILFLLYAVIRLVTG